ncbi:MAG: hypothetical protein QNJ19_16525 [Woeseiaceae bacterium]|nr:hypothetical protein [Woeseiaceae bacterium]
MDSIVPVPITRCRKPPTIRTRYSMMRRWYMTDISAEKKMTIGRTLIAKLKPIVSVLASGPNRKSMPSRE